MEVLSKHFVFNDRNVRVGAIRDLTERKMAEKAAKDSLRFLQALMDTIPNPIFYKGTDGILL
ncbi:hypothetical protein [Peptoclostridium litorale]|uniref:hypothetical protein n=1 Tax=Peptoclostridium litorale TaxID=1557 RepID=UPI0005701179|nr:hypothetical protein [Peptoclostridium litorale]